MNPAARGLVVTGIANVMGAGLAINEGAWAGAITAFASVCKKMMELNFARFTGAGKRCLQCP